MHVQGGVHKIYTLIHWRIYRSNGVVQIIVVLSNSMIALVDIYLSLGIFHIKDSNK